MDEGEANQVVGGVDKVKSKKNRQNNHEDLLGNNEEKQRNTDKNKKKKKKALKFDGIVYAKENGAIQDLSLGVFGEEDKEGNDAIENSLREKKKKKEKKSKATGNVEVEFESNVKEGQQNTAEYASKGKKRKAKSQENVPTPSKSNKKVRFSGEVEVFPLPDDSNIENDQEENLLQGQEDDLVQGKRFTKEEDAIIKEAVYSYVANRGLGEDGLDMVLNCIRHSQLKGCWIEIAAAIPYRPYLAFYRRAQVLFKSNKRKWTEEDMERIKEHQAKHGNEWKSLAEEFGTYRWNVKDAWRRVRVTQKIRGHWSQEEYQRLFNLVNTDLQLKVGEEKKSKHGMFRDNIAWTAISEKVASRNHSQCCVKWYTQLTSPMVKKGEWANVDDYRLLDTLYRLDANCMEDVDWDNILDNRSADQCRKRWNEMVLHIGHHGNRPFSEQVDVLAQRYCPNLIEARESWDNKPRVP